jgi:hypothetical protein
MFREKASVVRTSLGISSHNNRNMPKSQFDMGNAGLVVSQNASDHTSREEERRIGRRDVSQI